uniref:Family with sequence similarity 220 member A n=1 Tax=Pipistrellus kuhlii TaxID=59472 RepID=A0A7J7XA33_PIPKU|nr:family with sequence similarity 220 member A [Pipistrellus kuhlii]
MRDGTGTLGTGLAKEPRGDSAKRPCSLRARESPRPPGARPWAEAPAGDDHGNAQNETVSLETTSAPREAWLPGGTEVLACLTESLRRNWAAAVAPSFGPAEERLAGVPCGVGAARVRDWLEGARASSSHRGRCRRGELGGPGLPRGPRSGAGVSAGAPGALPERRVSAWEPPGRPEVLPSDGSARPRAHSGARGGAAPRTPDLRGPAAGPWALRACDAATPVCRGGGPGCTIK